MICGSYLPLAKDTSKLNWGPYPKSLARSLFRIFAKRMIGDSCPPLAKATSKLNWGPYPKGLASIVVWHFCYQNGYSTTQPVCGVRLCPADGGIPPNLTFERRLGVAKAKPRRREQCAAPPRGVQGQAPASFSWFVLCRAAKNEHPKALNSTARPKGAVCA